MRMREGERGRARASEGEYACESFIAEREKDRGGGKKKREKVIVEMENIRKGREKRWICLAQNSRAL